ncbi:MAG: hypothetical protein U9O24_07600 [Campylobacterota bacterium]|nr:hypothetical protein [Campylobacterota bacterium]
MVWYIANGYRVDLDHLAARLKQSCDWQEKEGVRFEEEIVEDLVLKLLRKRIESLDIKSAKRDIEPFISDRQVLDIWSKEFFLSLINELKFENIIV